MLRSAVATLLGAFILVLPRAAAALTVGQASIHVDPKKGDAAKFGGTLAGFSLGPTDDVTVTIDGVTFRIAHADLKQKKAKISYHDKTKNPGVGSLKIDLATQHFSVTLKGLAFGSQVSPTRLEIGGHATECALVPVATSAKHPPPDASTPEKERLRARGFKLVADKSGTQSQSCGLSTPDLDPASLVVGDPGTVTVRVRVTPTVDAGSVQLSQADVAGGPVGTALCALTDDGQHGDTVAGDGQYACTLTRDTSTPSAVTVVATASAGGRSLRSSPAPLRVVAPLSDADAQAIVDLQAQAQAIWDEKKAALGDGLEARLATLAALRRLPGIASLLLVDANGSIVIVYPSGVIGGLDLTPREDPDGPPAALASRAESSGGPSAARALAVPPPDAVVVGNRHVLIYDPGFFGDETEVQFLLDKYQHSTCPVFDTTVLRGADASLAALQTIPSFGTLAFVTHGFRFADKKGDYFTGMLTGEGATKEGLLAHAAELQRGSLLVAIQYLAITPTYVRAIPGTYPHTLLWGGFCWSGDSAATVGVGSTPDPTRTIDSIAATWVSQGVGAFVGFSRKVSNSWPPLVATPLVSGLLDDNLTSETVLDRVDPKWDGFYACPDAGQGANVPQADWVKLCSGASSNVAQLVVLPAGGKPLVYLKPSVTPASPTVEPGKTKALRAAVEGANGCTLKYRWRNTGTVGHLVGGDDTTSTVATRTYRADAHVQGTDTITIDVLDIKANPARTLFTLTSTVTVTCTACNHAPAGTLRSGAATDVCTPREVCCLDGEDNDGDDLIDCADPDCLGNVDCQQAANGRIIYTTPTHYDPPSGPPVFGSQITKLEADRTGEAALTAWPATASFTNPRWSPTGTRIAAWEGLRSGPFVYLGIFDATKPSIGTGDMQAVATFPNGNVTSAGPTWSPDETQLAYAVGGSGGGVYVLDVATKTSTQLVVNPSADLIYDQPAWSPDGTLIAVRIHQLHVGTYGHRDDIGVVSVADGDVTDLTQNRNPDGSPGDAGCAVGGPSWSPDSQRIVYHLGACDRPLDDGFGHVGPDPYQRLAIVTPAGDLTLVTPQNAGGIANRSFPTFSPDGTMLVAWGTPDVFNQNTLEFYSATPPYDPIAQFTTGQSVIEGPPSWQPVPPVGP